MTESDQLSASFSTAINAVLRALERDCVWEGDKQPELPMLNLFLAPQGLGVTHVAAPLALVLETSSVATLVNTSIGYKALVFPGGGRSVVLLGDDGLPGEMSMTQIEALYAGDALILHVLPESHASDQPPAHTFSLKAYWSRYMEIVLAGIGVNFIALLVPVFSMLVYDKVVGNKIGETLWALALGMAIAILMDFTLRAVRAWHVEQIAQKSDVMLDRSLLRRVLHHDAAVLPPVGAVLNKYKELSAARDFMSSGYLTALADLPFFLLFMLIIWIIGGPLVLVVLTTGGLMVLSHLIFNLPAYRYSTESSHKAGEKISLMAEMLAEGEILKTSMLRIPVSRRWMAASESAAALRAKGRFWTALASASTNFWMTATTVSVLVAGVYLIEDRLLTVGGLIACNMLAGRGVSSLASVVLLATRFREMQRSSRELNELLMSAGETKVAADTVAPRKISGRVTVRRMSYRFAKDGPLALEDLTFNIEPGERVGLLGRPGSGKTTLLRTMAGVIRPSAGEVMLDGVAVRQLDAYSRARWMAYKPQEPMLFAGSLEENIRAGADFADEFAMEQALRVSGLDECIRRGELHMGMSIESRGTNISGGQRQAVALARALLTSPSIMLLDEPTAGLDNAGEKVIAARLREFSQGKTLIVATHSHAMLAMLDRLIVVEGGRIVADGPRERVLISG